MAKSFVNAHESKYVRIRSGNPDNLPSDALELALEAGVQQSEVVGRHFQETANYRSFNGPVVEIAGHNNSRWRARPHAVKRQPDDWDREYRDGFIEFVEIKRLIRSKHHEKVVIVEGHPDHLPCDILEKLLRSHVIRLSHGGKIRFSSGLRKLKRTLFNEYTIEGNYGSWWNMRISDDGTHLLFSEILK